MIMLWYIKGINISDNIEKNKKDINIDQDKEQHEEERIIQLEK